MAEDDRVDLGEASAQAREAPSRRPGVVDHRDARARSLDHTGFGEHGAEDRVVDVPVHRGHIATELDLAQDRQGSDVAGVQDEVGRAQSFEAGLGEPPGALGHVGVGDDRELHVSRGRYPERPSAGKLGDSAPVAQWIERSPPEREVAGSNPAGRALGIPVPGGDDP